MRKFLTFGLVVIALSTTACNTIEGVGRDVSAAGQAVAGAAKSARS